MQQVRGLVHEVHEILHKSFPVHLALPVIHSAFISYVLNFYCMSGTALGTGETAIKKKLSTLLELTN
jgi:hypothetical protein